MGSLLSAVIMALGSLGGALITREPAAAVEPPPIVATAPSPAVVPDPPKPEYSAADPQRNETFRALMAQIQWLTDHPTKPLPREVYHAN